MRNISLVTGQSVHGRNSPSKFRLFLFLETLTSKVYSQHGTRCVEYPSGGEAGRQIWLSQLDSLVRLGLISPLRTARGRALSRLLSIISCCLGAGIPSIGMRFIQSSQSRPPSFQISSFPQLRASYADRLPIVRFANDCACAGGC